MKIRFNVTLNLPHIIYIYRGLNLIGQINIEFNDLTLFESVDWDESCIIFEK